MEGLGRGMRGGGVYEEGEGIRLRLPTVHPHPPIRGEGRGSPPQQVGREAGRGVHALPYRTPRTVIGRSSEGDSMDEAATAALEG